MSFEKCKDLSIQIHDLMMDIVAVDSDLISKLITLEMHETKYEYPQKFENLQTMCKSCHRIIHSLAN